MRTARRASSVVVFSLLVVLTGAAWLAMAPSQLGGPVTYALITGNSMEPALNSGDLVLVRAVGDYRMGDIVAYRHPNVGVVIHRIASRDGQRFVLKGDNNTWDDGHEPTASELIGTPWAHLPRVGRLVEGLRTPWVVGVLAGVAAALALAGLPRKMRQTSARSGRSAGAQGGGMLNLHTEEGQGFLAVLGIVAIACVALGGVSLTQPTEHEASRSVGYQQTGAFDYSANSPVPGVYDGDVAGTGEPIFRRLTSEVLVAFSYRFVTESPHLVGGTHRLTAVVSDTAGWRRTIELQPETAFSGDVFRAEGVLDLAQLYALVNHLEAETGVRRDHYTVAVAPEVAIEGVVAGQELRERFAPRLGFRLDQNQFQALPAGPRETDPRTPSQSGSVEVPHVEPASLSLLSLRLAVADARKFAAAGLVIALGGAGARPADCARPASR